MTIERLRAKSSYLNAIVIALSLVFLLWRARYGWCFDDEPFIVSLAKRLSDGQRLLSEEWHVAQLTGVLLLPFYKLFHLFSDSNDGILLTFRYIYCVLWYGVCFIAYRVLSRKNIGAIWVFVFLVLFSPLDYMTLSYTSLGLMAALLLCCLYYSHFEVKPLKALPLGVLSSLLWCVLVLSCPYMAAAYVLLFAGSLTVSEIKKRKAHPNNSAFLRSRYFDLALTAVIAALVCYFFILRGKSIDDILFGLECMTHDPQHFPVDYAARISEGIIEYDSRSRLMWLAAAAAICLAPLIKKHRGSRLAAFAVLSLCFAICMVNYMQRFRFINGQVEDIVPLGFAAYSLLRDKPRTLLRCFAPISVVYAVAGVLCSNTGSKVLSMCLLPAGAVGILCIIALGCELGKDFREVKLRLSRAAPALIAATVMLTQLSCTLYIRLTRQYHESGMKELTETIDYGSCKGLVVTPDRKAEYEQVYHELHGLLAEAEVDPESDSFMSPDFYPVLYLDSNLPMAVFSSWSFGYDEGLGDRLSLYYERFPHMMPTVIYSFSDSGQELAERWLSEHEEYSEGNSVLYKKKN